LNGDKVVSNPLSTLKDGQKVQMVASVPKNTPVAVPAPAASAASLSYSFCGCGEINHVFIRLQYQTPDSDDRHHHRIDGAGLTRPEKLKVNQIPDVDQPLLVVSVPYPGASPETVERGSD
jgi:hypothetical protein